MGGAQKINDAQLLAERARLHNIPIRTLSAYINRLEGGVGPHAGGSIGLERFIMVC